MGGHKIVVHCMTDGGCADRLSSGWSIVRFKETNFLTRSAYSILNLKLHNLTLAMAWQLQLLTLLREDTAPSPHASDKYLHSFREGCEFLK